MDSNRGHHRQICPRPIRLVPRPDKTKLPADNASDPYRLPATKAGHSPMPSIENPPHLQPVPPDPKTLTNPADSPAQPQNRDPEHQFSCACPIFYVPRPPRQDSISPQQAKARQHLLIPVPRPNRLHRLKFLFWLINVKFCLINRPLIRQKIIFFQ